MRTVGVAACILILLTSGGILTSRARVVAPVQPGRTPAASPLQAGRANPAQRVDLDALFAGGPLTRLPISRLKQPPLAGGVPAVNGRLPEPVPQRATQPRAVTYAIRPGDTLWTVAGRHHVTIRALAQANGLTEEATLQIGQVLTIPLGGGTAAATAAQPSRAVAGAAASPTVTTGPARGASPEPHAPAVVKGAAPSPAARGPAAGTITRPAKAVPVPSMAAASRQRAGRAGAPYTVVAGDTLWTIAARYRLSVEELAAMNGMSDQAMVRIGQVITVPGAAVQRVGFEPERSENVLAYTVQPGDSLWSLATRHKISVDRLAGLNGMSPEGSLIIGRTIKVPSHRSGQAPIPKRSVRIAQAPQKPAPPAPAVVRSPQKAPAALPAPRTATQSTPYRRVGTLPYRGVVWANSLIGVARRYMGTRYVWGGESPRGFDCSGFLQYVFGRLGLGLPRTTQAMFAAGRVVPQGELMPGDLVFFTTYRPGPSHAGIFLGNGLFIHSSSGYGSVTVTPMSKPYYHKRYLGARRF